MVVGIKFKYKNIFWRTRAKMRKNILISEIDKACEII